MKLPFGFQITRTRATEKSLSPVDNRGGWWPVVRESFAGAWQKNVTVTMEDALQNGAVFTCVKLIAGDIAKMRVRLVEQQGIGGIWQEVEHSDYSPLLAKPNRSQTRIQFFRNWMESKLTRGNTYVLKERDTRGKVVALYVLDPHRVIPYIDESGAVYYQLMRDDFVAQPANGILVPASEIIHDRWNTLYHPLVGLSPIYAAGVSALTSLNAQRNSANLFKNSAQPGGVLSAPGTIDEDTVKRLKENFESNFTGDLAGKVAVLGDGLTYERLAMSAVEAELIEQLKWSDLHIAGIFGIPAYKINAGTVPISNNVAALNQLYYSDTLQPHIEDIEILLDDGLELGKGSKRRIGTEFDLNALLRMDMATLVKTAGEGVKNGILKPNEARAMLDLPTVPGGDTPYLQHQNYGLAALAKRDAKDDPFETAPKPEPEAPEEPDEPDASNDNDEAEAALAAAKEAFGA